MAYQAFQGQPTPVDVQLFGQAAEAGAKLGQEIPNPITSIIQGGEQGYKYGLDVQKEQQQIDDQTAITKIHQLDADSKQANQSLQIQATQAQLQDQTVKDTSDAANITAQNKFLDQYAKADQATKQQLVLGGAAFQALGKSPGAYKDFLQQATLDFPQGSPGLQQLNKLLGHANIDDAYAKIAQENIKPYLESRSAILDGNTYPANNTIASTLGVPPLEAPYAVKWVDSGTLQKDPATGKAVVDETGQPKQFAVNYTTHPDLKGKSDAVSVLPNSQGLIVVQGVDAKERAGIENYKTQDGLQSGLHALQAKQYVDTNSASTQTQQGGQTSKVNINTFGSQTPAVSAATTKPTADPFTARIQKELSLPAQHVETIQPSVDQLKLQMNSYIADPASRNSVNTKLDFNHSITTIARATTDAQFKSSPALQSQYTQGAVDKYNTALDSVGSKFSYLPKSVQDRMQSVVNTFKVSTPEELYYANQGGSVTNKLQNFVNAFMSDVSSRDARAASNSGAIQARNAHNQDLMNGGSPQ